MKVRFQTSLKDFGMTSLVCLNQKPLHAIMARCWKNTRSILRLCPSLRIFRRASTLLSQKYQNGGVKVRFQTSLKGSGRTSLGHFFPKPLHAITVLCWKSTQSIPRSYPSSRALAIRFRELMKSYRAGGTEARLRNSLSESGRK